MPFTEDYCDDYIGIACENGCCPMDNIDSCRDCFYYEGCKDCILKGTEYCRREVHNDKQREVK